MRITRTSLWALLKIAIAAAIAAILMIIVLNASTRPVRSTTHTYTADFSDVSGLRVNGDVRLRGVQVGKVSEIELRRSSAPGTPTVAHVTFTLDEEYGITDATRLAVKYQNLTGLRYIDVTGIGEGRTVSHVGLSHTTPSFDITELFNGLQPVLNTLSTEEINEVSQNAITLLQGDGGGLTPLLDSIERLGDYASNREQVISVLVENLARISDTLGGRADSIVAILHSVEIPVDSAISVIDEFTKTSILGPAFMGPVAEIVRGLGLSGDMDIDKMISSAFGSIDRFAASVRLMPVAFDAMQSQQVRVGPRACSKGAAPLPDDVKLFLDQRLVTICRK
ncbi:MlaD family protein [Gordonia shandongensis]|uniref:MlaD family protein n=1 Tax=Gordonia shandongensis TaxID=376351 RepID=UPI000421ACCF|nr:MlaD family protein [Gordonia shandongensis]